MNSTTTKDASNQLTPKQCLCSSVELISFLIQSMEFFMYPQFPSAFSSWQLKIIHKQIPWKLWELWVCDHIFFVVRHLSNIKNLVPFGYESLESLFCQYTAFLLKERHLLLWIWIFGLLILGMPLPYGFTHCKAWGKGYHGPKHM
jgi:hypothetical protein